MLIIQRLISNFIGSLSAEDQQRILKWDSEDKIEVLENIGYREKDRENIQMIFLNQISDNQLIATMIFINGIYFYHYEQQNLESKLRAFGKYGLGGGAVLGFGLIGLAALAGVGLYRRFLADNDIKNTFFDFQEIENIIIDDQKKIIITKISENDDNEKITFNSQLICGGFSEVFLKQFCNLFNSFIKEIDSLTDSEENDALNEELETLYEQKNWDCIIQKIQAYQESGNELNPFQLRLQSVGFNRIGHYEQSMEACHLCEQSLLQSEEKTSIFDFSKEHMEFYSLIAFSKASNLAQEKDPYQAHWYYNIAEKYLPKNGYGKLDPEFKTEIEASNTNFISTLLTRPYSARKLIVPFFQLPATIPENLIPVKIGYTTPIIFASGEPLEGEIYIGHPLIKERYYTIDEYEQKLMEAQVLELSYLLQCLGATKLIVEQSQGKKIFSSNSQESEEAANENVQVCTDADVKLHSVKGNIKNSSKNAQSTKEKSSNNFKDVKWIVYKKEWSPTQPPHIPEGLIWFPKNETSQSIAKARLTGNVLKENLKISSASLHQISSNEFQQIQKEFTSMIDVGYKNLVVNGNIKTNREAYLDKLTKAAVFLKENKNMTLEFSVEYAPIQTLQAIPPETEIQFNVSEEAYADMVKRCYENNTISKDARDLLNRKRDKLDLTQKQVDRIETVIFNSFPPSFTKSEKDYLDEYKFCLSDGKISPIERQELDIIARQLGLSTERIKELENYNEPSH